MPGENKLQNHAIADLPPPSQSPPGSPLPNQASPVVSGPAVVHLGPRQRAPGFFELFATVLKRDGLLLDFDLLSHAIGGFQLYFLKAIAGRLSLLAVAVTGPP